MDKSPAKQRNAIFGEYSHFKCYIKWAVDILLHS